MKNENLLKNSINLILNYHGLSIKVEFKKYKTLIDVKQKVFDLFYPIKHNINIFLNNKNLEPFVKQPIGYIFSGQSLVNLNVVDEGVISTPFKLVNRCQDSLYSINDLITNYGKTKYNFITKANKTNSTSIENTKKLSKINFKRSTNIKTNKSYMLNKNKLFLLKTELNMDNNIKYILKNLKIGKNKNLNINKNNSKKMFNSSSVDNINTKKYLTGRKKLPPILQKNNSNINKSNNIKIVYNKCNDCYINNISKYCRFCDKFICNNCALNKKGYHIEHKDQFIELIKDSNKANIQLYQKIINKQLKDCLSSFNSVGKKKNNNKENNEQDEEDEKDNKNNDNENTENNNVSYIDYNEIMTKINGYVYKLVDQATEMKNDMKQIEFNQIKEFSENDKIQSICDNEKNVLRELNLFEYVSPFQPFFILNDYEKNMDNYFNNFIVNKDERNLVKTKIELMFENAEKEVDIALTEINNIIGDLEL